MIARIGTATWLTLVWVLLWGTPTPANIAGGLVVAVTLTWAFPVARSTGTRFHLVSIVRFALWFVTALVVANVKVAREVVRPRLRLDQSVVAVQLRATSDLVTAFVANSISLTPGTLTVEVRPDPGDGRVAHVLEVHSLNERDEGVVRRDCAAIEALVVAAFGTDDDRRRLVPGDATGPTEEDR